MTQTRVSWQQYLGAARRRIAIARFHLDGLQKLLLHNGGVRSDTHQFRSKPILMALSHPLVQQ